MKAGQEQNPIGAFDEPAVEMQAKFRHGVGFVDVRPRKEIDSDAAKDTLRVRQQAAIVLATSGNIKQPDQDTLWAGADGVVEITGNAFADEDCCDVGTIDRGENRRNRLWRRYGFIVAGAKERTHKKLGASRKLAQETEPGNQKLKRAQVGMY